MAMLADKTVVDARTGRKVSNALTLTFKTSPEDDLAVATQAGGAKVLFGFKNGGRGKFTLAGGGESVTLDCADERTTARGEAGTVGTIEEEGNGEATFRDASGAVLAIWQGFPYAEHGEATWPYTLLEPDGSTVLGLLRLLRTSLKFDLLGEAIDTAIWWDRPGQGMKLPTLGARLELRHPVGPVLGDLLLAACVDATIGPHDHLRR